MDDDLIRQKLDQAVGILDALGLDAWLTFGRETSDGGDPALPLILGRSVTWQSAFIVTRSGERVAVVGSHDAESIKSLDAWSQVIGYVQSIRGPLIETLSKFNPVKIAINYSMDDPKADGLSHGLWLLLREYLGQTPFIDRFVSADGVIRALRGRKSPAELDRIRRAIATTDAVFAEIARFARPGRSEVEIHRFMHERAAARGVGLAWDPQGCPIVSTGPQSMTGHAVPSAKLAITPGQIFHLDFGVRQDEYCSDLQRAWYVPRERETAPPDDVQRAFDTIVAAIEAAKRALRPGVECWRIDAIARQVIVDAGYPEYDHATGHQVGRAAHDGGGVLGPRWERYGRTPLFLVEQDQVFTLELGIQVPQRGYLGLEEMVIVSDSGCEWLSTPQTTLPLLEQHARSSAS
jgi:Xaa-Pro aminopeptidase